PTPIMDPSRAGWRFWLFAPFTLPAMMVRLARAEARRAEMTKTFAAQFRERLVPDFVAATEAALCEDLGALDGPALVASLEEWVRRTVVDFAREGLKPTALAA